MPARILIVDDHFPNIRFLEARLSAEYYQVVTASSGLEAIEKARAQLCDIILLDVMMPGLDGFATCRALKSDPATAHLPIVLVTALDQPADRLRGLEAGADDFLSKPIDDLALIARLRALTRMKSAYDDLRARTKKPRFDWIFGHDAVSGSASVLLVGPAMHRAQSMGRALEQHFHVGLQPDAKEALHRAGQGGCDLLILDLSIGSDVALRLCAQLRALERTRQLPVLLVADTAQRESILRAFDLGVTDYCASPVDPAELLARCRTLWRRKCTMDALAENLRTSIELAHVDALTGLHNRRMLDQALMDMIPAGLASGEVFSLAILDLDRFKLINDHYGHDAGDDVLRIIAQRLRGAVREGDLVCRLGGEEFAILMPGADLLQAGQIAERARMAVSAAPVALAGSGLFCPVTVSAGLASIAPGMGPRDLYRRADAALYRSKGEGRNRVSGHAA